MNIVVTILITLIGLGAISQYKTTKSINDTETPSYEVVAIYDQFEIRKYPQMIMATTIMGVGVYSKKSNKGFRTIASYIFGGNDKNQKINMTAPVMTSIEDTMRMSFIMPSSYSLDELPKPNSDEVEVHLQPGRIMAIISFGGFASDKDIKYYTGVLKNQLKNKGITNIGDVFFQGYNPPYQLFNRTNELAIEILDYE